MQQELIKNRLGDKFRKKYKLAHRLATTNNFFLKYFIGYPVRYHYRIFCRKYGIHIPEKCKIGNNIVIWHGTGLVINTNAVIGDNVILRHNTTIGNAVSGGPSPIIGNNVNVGANCVILGGIKIGDNVTIGAGSVVIKDIPSNSVVVGNPAKVIKTITN